MNEPEYRRALAAMKLLALSLAESNPDLFRGDRIQLIVTIAPVIDDAPGPIVANKYLDMDATKL